jgi:hypothetical protein
MPLIWGWNLVDSGTGSVMLSGCKEDDHVTHGGG